VWRCRSLTRTEPVAQPAGELGRPTVAGRQRLRSVCGPYTLGCGPFAVSETPEQPRSPAKLLTPVPHTFGHFRPSSLTFGLLEPSRGERFRLALLSHFSAFCGPFAVSIPLRSGPERPAGRLRSHGMRQLALLSWRPQRPYVSSRPSDRNLSGRRRSGGHQRFALGMVPLLASWACRQCCCSSPSIEARFSARSFRSLPFLYGPASAAKSCRSASIRWYVALQAT
jgi:hypothetical protein